MSHALPPPGQGSSVSNAVDAASAGSKLSKMRSATARARRSSLTRRIIWAALLGGRPSSMPNSSKQNQIKPSKKAWISLDSFGRIGTFQWVTANPNKKIFSPVTLCPKCHKRSFSFAGLEPRACSTARSSPPAEIDIAQIMDFEKRLQKKRLLALAIDRPNHG